LSRSVSPNGSPKRIRRGRGFSQRYAYARRYRTPSPKRSPVRSFRYSGRDRYLASQHPLISAHLLSDLLKSCELSCSTT
jgi:hypothetical protein